jgi:lipoprotein-anchoring transpeptidase ErfK/SrfK
MGSRIALWSALALGVVVLAVGCANDPRFRRETVYLGQGGRIIGQAAPHFDTVSYWDGDSASGRPSIVIDLSAQEARFYKGGQLVGVSAVSTGREGYHTPTGTFKVIQKDRDHRSTLYGDFVDSSGNVVVRDVDISKDKAPSGTHFQGAPMPYFMRVHGGTGMHAGFLPGFPASHGCIRMPEFMAEAFFQHASTGTPVTISH